MTKIFRFNTSNWPQGSWDRSLVPLQGIVVVGSHTNAPGTKLKVNDTIPSQFARIRVSVGHFYENWIEHINLRLRHGNEPKLRRLRAAYDAIGLWSKSESSKKLFTERMFNKIELRGAIRRTCGKITKWKIGSESLDEIWESAFPKAVKHAVIGQSRTYASQLDIEMLICELEALALNYSNSESKLRQFQRKIEKDESRALALRDLAMLGWLSAHYELEKSVFHIIESPERILGNTPNQ